MADGDGDLRLDPLNPPKYCPHCAKSGLKTKVKKFKLDPTKDDLTIMCKNAECPWPFSVVGSCGATVKEEHVKGKSKKRQGPDSFGEVEGGLPSEGKSPSKKKVKLDPCGKVEKLDPSLGTCSRDEKRPNAEDHVVGDEGGPPCIDQHEVSIDKSGEELLDPKARDCELKERLGDTGHGQDQEPSYRSTGNQEVEKNLSQPDSSVNKVKGATADVNESERDREEVEDETDVKKQQGNSRACQGDEEKEELDIGEESLSTVVAIKSKVEEGQSLATNAIGRAEAGKLELSPSQGQPESEHLSNLEDSTTVKEKAAREAAIRAAEESNKDLFNFSRIPEKVREPLKLPRRAADMLSSGRPLSPNNHLDVCPDSPVPPQSPPCALSDASESDSELESLASECSTMTAVSELSMGDEEFGGEGSGKIKRRGRMKKKKKDRRKLHEGKCSKEQHRCSDLDVLMTKDTELVAEVPEMTDNKVAVVENKVELTDNRGKTVEIVELNKELETEVSLPQAGKLSNLEERPLAQEEPLEQPMEVEDVNRSVSSPAEIEIDKPPPCADPPPAQSIFDPLPMSTDPAQSPPNPMSVTPQAKSSSRASLPEVDHAGEYLDTDGDQKMSYDNRTKNNRESNKKSQRGERSRQGIRVLLPKETSEFDTEDEHLEPPGNSNFTVGKGVKEQNVASFKSPLRPVPPSPARTIDATPPLVVGSPGVSQSSAPAVPSSPKHLGNLSPASLPSPGYVPRSVPLPSLLSPMPVTPRRGDEGSHDDVVMMTLAYEKPRPAGTFLEKLAEKLTRKQEKDIGKPANEAKKSSNDKVKMAKTRNKRAKKGRKPSKFGGASFMSEESSSEEEVENEGSKKEDCVKDFEAIGPETGSKESPIKTSSEKDGPQSTAEMLQKECKDPVTVPGITATQAPPPQKSPTLLKSPALIATPSASKVPSQRTIPVLASPGTPTRLRMVVPVKGSLPRLPTNLVPCAPPPHLRMRAPSGSPLRSPRTPNGNLVGSPRPLNLTPCAPPIFRSSTAPSTPPSSLPPTAPSTPAEAVARVSLALQRQNAQKNGDKASQSGHKSCGATAKTFSRKPKAGTNSEPKTLMGRRTGLGIDATKDNDVCIDLPTLSLNTYEPDLPGFDTVLKLGSKGAPESTQTVALQPEEETEDCEDLENSVVFHVANQAMINQPTGGDNLEVKEQGSTRVLLTASSNQIEVHDLKEAVNRSYQRHHRGQPANLLPHGGSFDHHGRGWFQWKDWRVDEPFIAGFASYMQTLVTKWRHQLQPDMDPKISALLREREVGGSKPEVMQKIIVFFAEVFVKYLFIRSNFPDLSIDRLLDILRRFYSMDNTMFSNECNPGQRVHLLLSPPQEKPTENTGRRTITVAKMAALAKQNLTPVTASSSMQPPAPSAHQSSLTPATMRNAINSSRGPGSSSRPSQSSLTAVPNLADKGSSQPLPLNVAEIKEEIEEEPASVPAIDIGSVQSVRSVQPASCQVTSVYGSGQSAASVHQLPSVSPATPNETIGEGPKVLQFFYQNPAESIRIGFTPVRVTSDEEVNSVVALVTEKAEEYNRKHGLSEKPVQYLTSAVRARSLLLPEIVRHIDKCFTKKGIKEAQRGLRKRTYQPRKSLIKIPPDQVVKPEETEGNLDEKPSQEEESGRKEEDKVNEGHDDETTVDFEEGAVKEGGSLDGASLAETEPIDLGGAEQKAEGEHTREENTPESQRLEEDNEEEVDDVEECVPEEEYVPEEGEMKGVLEEKIFGGLLPKAVRKLKPPRKGISERTGRGGRNETNNGAPETVVLGAVNYMLGNTVDGERPTLSLSSLFGRKMKKRRKKQRITVDDLEDPDTEDDDYKGPGVRKNRGATEGVRKSKRLVDNRRFWGDVEQEGDEVLVPLEDPSQEEEVDDVEEYVPEPSKEEYAETPTTAVNVAKEEYGERVVRDGSSIKLPSDDSASEEREGSGGRESRMRRGRLPPEDREPGQGAETEIVVTTERVEVHVQQVVGVNDLLNAAPSRPPSQAGSRPSSQNSRPPSQNSRPGSALPSKVAKQLERIASPDRDSPVLAPRNRRQEKEERARSSIDGQHVARPESRQAASSSKSPSRAAGAPCDNYLKKNDQKQAEMQKAFDAAGKFDQEFVRGGKSEKVRKHFEKLKKRAMKNSKGEQKKYKGFGETKEIKEDKAKRQEEKERKKAAMKAKMKKAEVTRDEAALIAELLQAGETAVAESRQASQEEEEEEERERQRTAQLIARQEAAMVEEFEASQGLAGPSTLSQQLDDLFGL